MITFSLFFLAFFASSQPIRNIALHSYAREQAIQKRSNDDFDGVNLPEEVDLWDDISDWGLSWEDLERAEDARTRNLNILKEILLELGLTTPDTINHVKMVQKILDINSVAQKNIIREFMKRKLHIETGQMFSTVPWKILEKHNVVEENFNLSSLQLKNLIERFDQIIFPERLKSEKMKKFNDFNVLSLSIPDHSPHYIYFKEHSTRIKNPELPEGRTLFVVNIPVDANFKTLKKLFKDCGTLERFVVKQKSEFGFTPDNSILKSGTSGHLIFKEEDAIEHISNLDQLEYSPPKNLGINKWITEYLEMIPDSASLRKSIDQELLEFEEMERIKKLQALEARNMPDKDGFVTVTRRGRRNTNKDGAGAIVSAIDPRELKNIKPKEQKLVDFYRFQKREAKKNALQDLRKKFEEDKQKIQKLKENRKFKPY